MGEGAKKGQMGQYAGVSLSRYTLSSRSVWIYGNYWGSTGHKLGEEVKVVSQVEGLQPRSAWQKLWLWD